MAVLLKVTEITATDDETGETQTVYQLTNADGRGSGDVVRAVEMTGFYRIPRSTTHPALRQYATAEECRAAAVRLGEELAANHGGAFEVMGAEAAPSRPAARLDDIYDAMRDGYRAALTAGRNWHAVTVGTDGVPYAREEVSRCVSESEYFGKGEPYPVTVWSMNGDSSVSEDEIDGKVEAFEPADHFDGYGGVAELVARLERAGFAVEQ